MPIAAYIVTGEDWSIKGPQTPAQELLHAYGRAVDNYGYEQGSGLQFYSKDVVFHNQNNVDYHGASQMWPWMKQLFGQFAKMRHDILRLTEVKEEGAESSFLTVQMKRNIWLPGNTSDVPDVSAPMAFFCRTGPGDDPQAVGGLQMTEVWIYWDTALLAPFLSQDAVVFRTKNPFESEGAS
ncbi:hypothetical protein H2200_000511 [Cladophialophora chaetospira]|uniref:SnoaL-like domain-containing protein n=1 Tax=Cladophialophora chaetospira TaxID=386627 RepID=A0AA38XNP2_9EURO|nr:hypothetical protein H2200_000511 [Cladophialophora chaetospira]